MKPHELHDYSCPECAGNIYADTEVCCTTCNGTGKHPAITELLEALIKQWFFLEKMLACCEYSMNLSWYDNVLVEQLWIEKTIESHSLKWDQIKKEIEL